MASCAESESKIEFHPDYGNGELDSHPKSGQFEDDSTRVQGLELLRSLLKKEKGLRWQDDDLFLLSFLRGRKFDEKRALKLIKGLYSSFGKYGHIYYNLDFDYLKRTMEENSFYFMASEESDSTVFIFRFTTWNTEVSSIEDYMICITLGFIQALRTPSAQIDGFRLIMDCKDFAFKHLLHVTPSVLFFMVDLLQNTVPMRVKGLHIVNQNSFFFYVYKIFNRLLSKKLRDRFHFHGDDMQGLQKYVHPSILPAELGGELPPFDNTEWRQKMEESFDYIKHALSFGYERHVGKNWKTP